MIRRFSATVLAVAIGISGLIAQPLAAHSLRDALRQAYDHSGLLHQNRALLRAADEDVAQAVSQLRPIINWSANYSYSSAAASIPGNDGRSFNLGISADLLLYDFGRTKLGIAAAKEQVLATRAALIGIEQDVLLRAANAYLNYRRALEFVALRESNVRLIGQELRASKDRFDVGEITRTDVALAEARLASARAGLANAQGDLARATAEYIAAVGTKPHGAQAPGAIPRGAASPQEAIAIARRNHPNMRQIRHSVAAAELLVQQAEAGLKPRVSANASLGFDRDFNDSFSVGITASGPIYQGGRLASVIRKAMAQRDAQRAGLHITRHAIDQSVQNAVVLADVARASAEASSRQIRAAQTAFRGVREEASLGSRTTLDVLNAEQELLDARAGLISANVDAQIAGYTLLATMGLMTAEHLKLGVQTYDPEAYFKLVETAPVPTSRQGQALDRVLKSISGD